MRSVSNTSSMNFSDKLSDILDKLDNEIEKKTISYISKNIVPQLKNLDVWMDGTFTLFTRNVNVMLDIINYHGMNLNGINYKFCLNENHFEIRKNDYQWFNHGDKYNFPNELINIGSRFQNFELDENIIFGDKKDTINNVKDWNFFKFIIESKITTNGDIERFEYTVGFGLKKFTTKKDYQKMLDIVHAQENKIKKA